MTLPTPTIGSIAATLFRAESAFLAAEAVLEQFLDALFGRDGWEQLEFERYERIIEVFGALDNDEAVGLLWTAGFSRVVIHGHPRYEFSTCGCRTRRPS